MYKQKLTFYENICADICPRTLFVPRCGESVKQITKLSLPQMLLQNVTKSYFEFSSKSCLVFRCLR